MPPKKRKAPERKTLELGLKYISSNPAFWQVLGSEQIHVGCACHSVYEYQINGEKERKIRDEIEAAIVSHSPFAAESEPTSDQITLLYALLKMQDQIAMGKNFASKRTRQFCEERKITHQIDGVKIGNELLKIDDAAEFLRAKYQLNATSEKMTAIRKTKDNTLKKLGQISDVAWEDFVNEPLRRNSPKIYQNLPSIAMVILVLGTVQLLFRTLNQQESADNIRDNVGAASVMAAFFVVANMLLENLTHSFILAAPAFGATLAYDKVRKCLKQNEEQSQNNSDPEANFEEVNNQEIFCAVVVPNNLEEEKNILRRVKPYIEQQELWTGLRKWQLNYVDNQIEEGIKTALNGMITEIEEGSFSLLKQSQNLCDILHLLKSLSEVYAKNNNAGEINAVINDFVEIFGHGGFLLNLPSTDAREAGFCCRSHHQLVSFSERVNNSLPHLPTGSQVVLAGLVIGGIYAAKQIYEAATGEKEIYTNYVTDFPDHLFDWLQLGQMYQNIGGDASLSQPFRDFFASFNLAENSTHLGIALAPFFAYAQLGDKMFESMHHKSSNLAAYFSNSVGYYFDMIVSSSARGNQAPSSSPVHSSTQELEFGILPESIRL